MAYKFQVGNAILSGSLTQEGNVEIQNDAGGIVGIFDNAGVLSASAGATAATFTADGAITGGSLVVGSADMSEADLEKLDGITNGTAAASKALVLDGSKNIATIGTVGCGAITSTGNSSFAQVTTSGRVIVDDATDATNATDGSLQTDGGLSVAKKTFLADDLTISHNGAVITAGAANTFVLTHANANNTLMATSGHRLAFGDANDYITGDGTDLKLVSSGLVDITGDTKVTGFISGSGVLGGSAAKISGSVLAVSLEAEAGVTVGTLFTMPDNTSGKILVADGTSYQEVALSGDATIASNGALTLANNSVSQAQLDDDAVGADELASNAVVNASVVDGALKADKLDIDGSTDIGADLVDADLLIVDDGANGTNRKSTLTRMKKYVYSAISGDATVNDSGVLTISAGSSDVTVATDAVRLSSGYNYFTGSVSARCELPSGSIGTVVTVKAGDTSIGEAITITGSFSDEIDGATSVLLESPFAAVTMVYMSPGQWKIV